MDELALHFFPYPYLFRGKRHDGLLISWPDRCTGCDRQCEHGVVNELALCSYGINYFRIDAELMIAGVVVRDYPTMTPARRRQMHARQLQPSRVEIQRTADRAREATAVLEEHLEAERKTIISEYRNSRRYQSEIVELLRPEIEKALGQVHDYKAFVAHIIQNMNVIWTERYRITAIEDALGRAPQEEVAIYHAARLMEDRLDAALFLIYPERITDLASRTTFRVHGTVHKTVKIYEAAFDAKGVRLHFSGESFGLVEANYRAVVVIPHTLLDNALKYAPRDSDTYIDVRDDDEAIVLTVRSLGPRIEVDEIERIFDVFYRGAAARALGTEGTGFGLALASNIATHMGTEIRVTQESAETMEGYYWTTFSVGFPRWSEPQGRPSRNASATDTRRR